MTPDEAISHALEQCSTYGEYEFEYPAPDSGHRIGLRVVTYHSGLQAWYIPGAPFEWVPVPADVVMGQLEAAYQKEQALNQVVDDFMGAMEPAFLDDTGPSEDVPHRVTLGEPTWPRADPEALAAFDPSTKVCVMNCGPASGDPRTAAERKLLCQDCYDAPK
jgi:hypothetical protein